MITQRVKFRLSENCMKSNLSKNNANFAKSQKTKVKNWFKIKFTFELYNWAL